MTSPPPIAVNQPPVTRFAPSPTGYLHIGSARTALFNWLFARHHGGRFLLRIEDTDRERSTAEAVRAILDGMAWLGLDADEPPIYQFARAGRHAAAAHRLLAEGRAYRCYASPDELEAMRARQRAAGEPVRYDGRWRDRDPGEAPAGAPFTVRLRAEQSGETVIEDLVQGVIRVANAQLDDMVLLRADGTPTYMLAVVVDDHEMAISHVIRGSDHLTNTFRQAQLYRAFGWSIPQFAHIPLIHGADGAKLSKRHGALGVEAYRDQGILPEALCNYLLRLGWSHGDEEIIGRDRAIAWFDLAAVGRSPARFDMNKLLSVNAHYLRQSEHTRLADEVLQRLTATSADSLSGHARERLIRGMPGLKERAKTLVELTAAARFYALAAPITIGKAAADLLTPSALACLAELANSLAGHADWTAAELERAVRSFADSYGAGAEVAMGFRQIAQALRAALTGAVVSPPIFEVMAVLGRDETLARLRPPPLPPVAAAGN
jgi:glutamyl-tRNA synthetase